MIYRQRGRTDSRQTEKTCCREGYVRFAHVTFSDKAMNELGASFGMQGWVGDRFNELRSEGFPIPDGRSLLIHPQNWWILYQEKVFFRN